MNRIWSWKSNRKLNVKFLFLLSGVLLLASCGIYFVHEIQVKRTVRELLSHADRAERAGANAKAQEYLVRYLVYVPEDGSVLARLGRMRDAIAQTDEQKHKALRIYEKAVRQSPNDAETRRRLVRLAVMLGEITQAKIHLERLKSLTLVDSELNYLQGVCEEGTAKYREAVLCYENARKLDPTRLETFSRLANLYRTRLKDPNRADQVMDAKGDAGGLIATNPRSATAFLMRARYRQRYGVEAPSAHADIEQALRLGPDDADVLLAAAQEESSVGRSDGGDRDRAKYLSSLEKSLKFLDHGIKIHKKNKNFYLFSSRLEVLAGRPDDAVKRLRDGLEARVDDDTTLGYSLAELLLEIGRTEDATNEFKSLRARVRPELVRFFDARVTFARGRWADAAKLLERCANELAVEPENKSLVKLSYSYLTKCYERLGDPERRTFAARRAVDIILPAPDQLAIPARLELASSLMAQGKAEEALIQYRLIQPTTPMVGYLMVRLEIDLISRKTESQRDWASIERSLDQLERSDPGNIEQSLLRAAVASEKGDWSKAIELYKKAQAKHSDRPEPWLARATLLSQGGDFKAALAILDEARKQLGDRIEFRLARAALIGESGEKGAATALAELESGLEKLSPVDSVRLGRELSAAYTRLRMDGDALRVWTSLAVRRPDDLVVQTSVFDLALQRKDDELAARSIDRMRTIEGEDGYFWRFGEARWRLEQARRIPTSTAKQIEFRNRLLNDAETQLAKARIIRPASSRIVLAQAEIADVRGRSDQALDLYTRAILELGERNPRDIHRTFVLLERHGQFNRAPEIIRELEKDGPLTATMRRTIAEVAIKAKDYKLALEMAEGTLSAESSDFRDLLLLARIRAANALPAEALIRRAVTLAPGSPDAHILLAAYLAGQNRDPDAAKAALAHAEQVLPKDKVSLTLARGYQAIGEAGKAGLFFEAALKATPRDSTTLQAVALHYLRTNRIEDARTLLQRILDLKEDSERTTWARRTLAQVKAFGGKPSDAIAALAILDADNIGVLAETDPIEMRIRARILAQQPGRANRRKAIGILEELNKARDETADDHSLLAQLYDMDGESPKATEHLLKLIDLQPKVAAHLFRYATRSLLHGDFDEAKLFLARLKRLAPDQPGTIMLEARVLNAEGKRGEAVTLLLDIARRHESQVGPVARMLEEIGAPKEAEPLLRRHIDLVRLERPAAVLDLALFLGRQGRIAEAMDLIDDDRVWQNVPAETVANAGSVVLYETNSGDERQHQRLIRRLEEAIRREPIKDSLRFSLANIRILQARYDDAEAIFRAIYERDKTHATPLNNWAWMIALRGGGQSDKALHLIDQAIELEGELPNFLDTRALVHIAAGRSEPAIRDLLDAINSDPQEGMFFHLARAYRIAGKENEAVESFRKAQSLGLVAEKVHPLERKTFQEFCNAPNEVKAKVVKPGENPR